MKCGYQDKEKNKLFPEENKQHPDAPSNATNGSKQEKEDTIQENPGSQNTG